jgi:hypothetical protein
MKRKKQRKRVSDHKRVLVRAVKGCSREDRIRNETMRHDVQMYTIEDKLDETRIKWREHISRMEEDRLPETVISCKQRVRKLHGGPIHVCGRRGRRSI